MKLLEQIRENAKKQGKTIVLPEGTEERTLQAADQVLAEGIAKIILLNKWGCVFLISSDGLYFLLKC